MESKMTQGGNENKKKQKREIAPEEKDDILSEGDGQEELDEFDEYEDMEEEIPAKKKLKKTTRPIRKERRSPEEEVWEGDY